MALQLHGNSESNSPNKTRTALLLVILDGIGDDTTVMMETMHNDQDNDQFHHQHQQQRRRTPLERAKTPHLDALVRGKEAWCGLMDSVEPGIACGSDTAHLAILGYEPRTVYRGRGAFEAMGTGIHMKEGDVAFKSNFAYIDTDGVVRRRRADRNFHQWGTPLCTSLNNIKLPQWPTVNIQVQHATEHRAGVRIRDEEYMLSDKITGTDPLVDNKPLLTSTPVVDTHAARRTAAIVNDMSQAFHQALTKHPLTMDRIKSGLNIANIVLFRGAGERIRVPTFQQKYGRKAFAIAPTAIIAGLALSLGMDVKHVAGATGDYHTDLLAKATRAAHELADVGKNYGFCLLHVKAIDDAGHDRDIARKVHFIEESDKMIGLLVAKLNAITIDTGRRFTLAITGDHSTPVLHGDHSCEPVPFVVSNLSSANSSAQVSPNEDGFKANSFNEIECARGALGRFCGSDVMPLLQECASIAVEEQ